MRIRLFASVLCLGLLAGCGAADQEPSETASLANATEQATDNTSEPSIPESGAPVVAGTQIVAADSEFGPMLFDATGQAIYLFDVETTSAPACYDACAEAWPPVLTEGEPVAGAGVDGSLLATTQRSDGTIQVTYKNHPLYFYAHEGRQEVKCHDVFMNGGNWYVVQPDGNAAPPA